MRNLVFLLAAALYAAAVVQLRRAWRHPSADGAAVGRGRRGLLGAVAGARYFTPEGRCALRRAQWLLGAAAAALAVWATLIAWALRAPA